MRDSLRDLANDEGITLDAQFERLIRSERSRRLGAQLASAAPNRDERDVLEASVSDVAHASR